jgi:hypothetical protein
MLCARVRKKGSALWVRSSDRTSDWLEKRYQGRDTAGALHHASQDCRNLSGAVLEVWPKERASDDGESQAAHLLPYVDLCHLLPSRQKPPRLIPDDLDVRTDLIAVKRRLQNTATFAVARFLEREHSVSDEFPQYRRSNVTSEPMLLNHKNLFDQVGVRNKICMLMEKAEVRQRTELPGSVLEEAQGARGRPYAKEP